MVIIPGNFGIQEVICGYFLSLSGLSFVQGVAVSSLVRAVGLVITLALAPLSWYFLFFRERIKPRHGLHKTNGMGVYKDKKPQKWHPFASC